MNKPESKNMTCSAHARRAVDNNTFICSVGVIKEREYLSVESGF